jgi:hypothetical protein
MTKELRTNVISYLFLALIIFLISFIVHEGVHVVQTFEYGGTIEHVYIFSHNTLGEVQPILKGEAVRAWNSNISNLEFQADLVQFIYIISMVFFIGIKVL